MFASARRGAVALRSIRFLSTPISRTYIVQPLRTQVRVQNVAPGSSLARQFSSVPRIFQENVPEIESTQDAQQEFTEFQQLADAGIIHANVINTITKSMNIHTMTEVQRMTLNQCLDGDDVIAQARTGTGKTLAFLLPILQRILRSNPELADRSNGYRGRRAPIDIKGLIISPTRELAEQIAVEAGRLVAGTNIKVATAVGGTQKGMHLRRMRELGCHLLIGTPGRVNDVLSEPQNGVSMDNIETFVLDEADRLLDIGFAPAIEEIQSYMPNREVKPRQTLMFSATVPKTVVALVRQTMRPDFKFIRTVDPSEAPTHEKVPQKVVFLDGLQNQSPTILEIALNAIEAHKRDPVNNMPFKAIVYFGSTNEVTMAYEIFTSIRDFSSEKSQFSRGPLDPALLFRMNGKLEQRVRTRESDGFRKAESAILFSSDVTARGMDFPNVSHVIQVGLPRSADDYIHRIGRTGRAGKSGEGWLLLNKDEQRAFQRKMDHPGLQLEEVELQTAALDMKKPAQLPANVARIMTIIESGVKNVPHSVKCSVYSSLLAVLPQQFPDRQKQDQIDMMNELAQFGWGMQTPPRLSRRLVEKLGYGRCSGIEFDNRDFSSEGRSTFGRRQGGFDDDDPFSSTGKGVFGGRSNNFGDRGMSRGGGDSFSDRGFSRGGRDGFSDRGSSRGDRGGFGDRRRNDSRSSRRERDFGSD